MEGPEELVLAPLRPGYTFLILSPPDAGLILAPTGIPREFAPLN